LELSQEFVFVDNAKHDIKAFTCGKPGMDTFLARFAVKHGKLGISKTWVLPTIENGLSKKEKIAAYFTLSSSTVTREEIPFDKSLPGYPVPVVLLARLAVSDEYQGLGLGGKTLIASLRKAVELTDTGLPALGLILDVLDQEALKFYQHYEIFKPFTEDPMRLFAPMHVLRKI
jgi:GNAT superfamily N-acetyltransferase